MDSEPSFHLAQGATVPKRLKYVNVAISWVREQLLQRHIALTLVPTQKQPADFLTKPLPRAAHQFCCSTLGIQLQRVRTLDSASTQPAKRGDGHAASD